MVSTNNNNPQGNKRAIDIDQNTYFDQFSAYLRSGDLAQLSTVFPPDSPLDFASVYRNGFIRSCTEALASNFPCVVALVGADYFQNLATLFIDERPPQSSSLVAYGESFPAWLGETRNRHNLAYLPDFARLDQAWLHSYFARDAKAVSEQDVADWVASGREIPDLRVALSPSSVVITLSHRVAKAWHELKTSQSLSGQTEIEAQPQVVLLWRSDDDRVNYASLNAGENAFIAALAQTNTIGNAATAALEAQHGIDILSIFSRFLASDVFAHPDF